ncbi:hypothetical protein [Acinetobacter sp. Marseille-Q1618]|uniref:hypothetical protein n=1 Tax=Acinetobacter sp. Marseille-Q1618 TaxID=2697502 RepID=UPI00156DF023|nr:hypothetical protein [Acinetobacter sp. Marseille-Q1618]
MKMRLTFRTSGDNFKAQECIQRLYSNELNTKYDAKYPNNLSWVHPEEFVDYRENNIRSTYERAYLDFIMNNINEINRCGADDYVLFTEMYIEADEQCNFEILSEGFYSYIWKYSIALPTSVYICDAEGACVQTFLEVKSDTEL